MKNKNLHQEFVAMQEFQTLPNDTKYVYLERCAILSDGAKHIENDWHLIALQEMIDHIKLIKKLESATVI